MNGRIKREGAQPARIPIIGKVKVGEKTEKGYPTSLDYFKPTGKYTALFADAFGLKPQTIPVVFISDRVEDVCDERFDLYDAQGRRFGRGDGETFTIYNPKIEEYETYSALDYPDIMERSAKAAQGEWRATLELRFIIPAIRGVIGLWQFTTKGEASSIPSIRDAFDFVHQRAGTVVGVPFDLQVEKVNSQKPGSKSRFPVVTLVPNVSEPALDEVAQFLAAGHSVSDVRQLLKEETHLLTNGQES